MAGGGGGLSVERAKRGKKKRKKMKRVGFVLDMTPLVDITFLLLTFFMFTTTMAAPQVMEMSMPPEVNENVDVKASELLTIFVREDDRLFYSEGTEDPQPIELKDIRALAEKQHLKKDPMNPGKIIGNKMIVALKPAQNSNYGIVVNILDQLNVAEIAISNEVAKENDETGEPTKRKRRFTIAPISEDELVKIKDLQ